MAVFAQLFETAPRNWRSRLTASVDLMREISRHTDPDDLFRAFVQRMGELFPTDCQISLTRRGLDRPHARVTRFNRQSDPDDSYTTGPARQPVLVGGVLPDLLHAGKAQVFDDFRVSPTDPGADYLAHQRSIMTIPLFDGGAVVSMVVLTREQPFAFSRQQLPELVWMCNLFSRALQAQVKSDKLQAACDLASYDLQAVGELQHDLIPNTPPTINGLEFAKYYRTADRAGGDYYDFFPLAADKVGVLLADVSGHGVHAAVLLAITHSLAHAYPEPPTQPGRLLSYLNSHLARHYTQSSGSFVTAIYAVFDCASGTFRYATAGHPPLLKCLSSESKWASEPAPTGLPLGVSPRDSDYPEHVTRFTPGDRIALFTDGVVEAANPAGELFGTHRLSSALRSGPADAQGAIDAVVAALNQFVGPKALIDDRTLLVARCLPAALQADRTPYNC